LRLQVYERMRELARKQQDHLWGRTQNLEERLLQEYAGVTAAAIAIERRKANRSMYFRGTASPNSTLASRRGSVRTPILLPKAERFRKATRTAMTEPIP